MLTKANIHCLSRLLLVPSKDRHVKPSPGNSAVDREPEVDPSQDYQLLLGYENNTHTVLRFRRKLDTCDRHDIPITVIVDRNIDITTVKPVRLGSYAEGRCRPVRITLESEQRVSEILRNGRALKNYRYKNSKVFITPDRTPRQLLYYKKLRSQLQEKINSEPGTNWKIKYIHDLVLSNLTCNVQRSIFPLVSEEILYHPALEIVVEDKTTRKRSRKQNTWKKNNAALARQRGETYVNQRGRTIPAKVVNLGTLCSENCKKKCSDQLGTKERQNMFSRYYEPHKITDDVKQYIIEHIKLFPASESHYSRNKNPNKKYLSPMLNISKMYKLYGEKCSEENKPSHFYIKYCTYSKIFSTEFNLSFGEPRSDTCSTCDGGKGDEEHIQNYNEAFSLQRIDREYAKGNNGVCYLTMDLQETLPLPRLTTSKAFYLRQMWMYNLVVHSITKQGETANFFTWTEDVAHRGSSEVCSCLLTMLEYNKIFHDNAISHLILWTDSCAGQNKNFLIICLYQYLILKGIVKTIDHKFPEVGHSYLDSDRDFGRIEKILRRQENIYLPEEYRTIISQSSKNNHVTDMAFHFRNFEDLASVLNLINRKKNTLGENVPFRDGIKWIRVSEYGSYFYKESFDPHTPFKENDTMRVLWAHHPKEPIGGAVGPGSLPQHEAQHRGSRPLFLLQRAEVRLPDEAVKVWDAKSGEVKPGAQGEGIYWCQVLRGPYGVKGKHHLVRYEPLLSPKQVSTSGLQYIVLYECLDSPFLASLAAGSGRHCHEPHSQPISCNTVVASWARGSEGFSFPPETGYPMDEQSSRYYLLETHYLAPMDGGSPIPGAGLRLYYTQELRRHDAGVISIGMDPNWRHIIPPGQQTVVSSGHCVSECTRQAFPHQGINMFAMVMKTHKIGKKVALRHIRNGVELPPIAADDNLDSDYQEYRKIEAPVRVLPGDHLITQCTYNSSARRAITLGGLSSREETCLVLGFYYPRQKTLAACHSLPSLSTVLHSLGIQELSPLVSYDWDNQFDSFQEATLKGSFKPLCWSSQSTLLPNTDRDSHFPNISKPYVRSEIDQCSYRRYSTEGWPGGTPLIELDGNHIEGATRSKVSRSSSSPAATAEGSLGLSRYNSGRRRDVASAPFTLLSLFLMCWFNR
nr:unnamed protein product [Callosobruchus analis]